MALATLTIDINAKLANLQTSMDRAAQISEKSAQRIQAAFSRAGQFLAGIGAGISTGAIIQFVTRTAEAIDRLNDVSDATGSTVENISALEDVARKTGSTIETVETALVKFNQVLNEAKPGSPIEQALSAIGLSAQKLKQEDPAEALLDVATALDGYADDANKARLIQELFGKSLKEVAPFLHDLAAAGKLNATVTSEQAAQAERFNKQLSELRTTLNDIGRGLVSSILPALERITFQFQEVTKQSGALQGSLAAIGEASAPLRTFFETVVVLGANVAFVFKGIGIEIGGIVAQLAALGRADFKGFAEIGRRMKEDAAQARKEIDEFSARTLDRSKAITNGEGGPDFVGPPDGAKKLPKAPDVSNFKQLTDTTKSQLDQSLAALNAYISGEKQLLSSREQFLSAYYSADELSITAYFDARNAAQQEYLAKARQGYADEIAELEKFIKTAKPKDAIDAQTKLADVRQKLADVEREASEQTVKDWLDQRNAVQQYEDKLADLRAQILEFKGATGEAATIRFDISTRDIRKQLEAANDSAGLNDLAVVRQRTIIESSLKSPQDAAAIIQDQLRNTEQRIHIDQDIGATSELDALQKLSAARQDAVGQLKAIADQWEAIIAGTDDPRLKQNLENFKAQIDQLAAASDLLSQRLQTVGESGLTAFLDEMTSGTHDLTKAFQNMGKVFQQEITRMVSQDLSRRIFGKGEGSLDVFGALKNLFGAPASNDKFVPTNAAGTMSLASNVVSLIPRSMSVAPAASSTIAAAASNTAAEAANGASFAAAATAMATGIETSGTAAALAMSTGIETSGTTAALALSTGLETSSSAAAIAMATSIETSSVAAATGIGTAITTAGQVAAAAIAEAVAASIALASGAGIGKAVSLFPSANGNAFAGSGPVRAFASGGAFGDGEILTSPTMFRFASGGSFRTGVAGEAGPEAALPLKRMSNGKLGVATDGGGGSPIIINVHVPAGTAPQMRASAAQGAREALGALNRAKRYG